MVRLMRTAAILLVATGVAGCGDGERPATQEPSRTVPLDEQPASEPEPLPACSATGAGIPELQDQQGLPPAVDDTRREVYDAAIACDFDELAAIAETTGDSFSYTFGAPVEGGPAAYWRQVDASERVMEQLARVLTAPNARAADGGEEAAYVWPSVARDRPTDADWAALADAGIATADDVETLRSFGSYLGLRTGILPDGRWQFVAAGD